MKKKKIEVSGILAATVTGICLSFSLSMSQAFGFDPEKVFKPNEEPREILRYGYQALKDGKPEEAVSAFRFGAIKRNHLPSQWKLARMLQQGDQVGKDHGAAFDLYSQIVDRYEEIPPSRRDLPYVASAVVAVGHYHLTGLPEANLRSNPFEAERHFFRAAALYHDAEAQFQLARLYMSEMLGEPRMRNAVRWLRLSSKKGHPFAQAEMGRRLFYGEGIRRDRVDGLVWIRKAALSGNAHPQRDYLMKLQEQAFSDARRRHIRRANKKLRQQKLPEFDQ